MVIATWNTLIKVEVKDDCQTMVAQSILGLASEVICLKVSCVVLTTSSALVQRF